MTYEIPNNKPAQLYEPDTFYGDGGWIKVYRKLLDWEWWHDINTSRLYLYLLLAVNHTNKKWRGVQIQRGQIITSQQHLSANTGLTRQSVRSSLYRLKSTNEITIDVTSKYTVVTLVNYGLYQDSQLQSTNKTTSKVTIEQPAINQVLTTTKEGNKEKNVKNIGERKELFFANVQNVFNLEKEKFPNLNSQDVESFKSYWAEASKTAKKMRWEKQDAFDVSLRLQTWQRRKLEKDSPTHTPSIPQPYRKPLTR